MTRKIAGCTLLGIAVLAAGRGAGGECTWNGSVSTEWTTAGNWTGGLPGAGDVVVVPSGTSFAPAIPAGTNPVSGAYASFTVAKGATVTCLGDPAAVNEPSGGTVAKPHGIGVTIFATNAMIDGTLSAVGKGFPGGQGPGFTSDGGGTHGGKGTFGYPLWQIPFHRAASYGSVSEPTALGSGGHGGLDRSGGGAILLAVEDSLTVNGMIDATAAQVARSGSGGSIWLTATTLAGTGTIRADGGNSAYGSSGGGGRVAIVYAHSTFSGLVSVAGGSGTLLGQPGSLWEPKRFDGMRGAPGDFLSMLVTNTFQYHFPDAAATNYWNLTVSNAWFEAHGGAMRIGDLRLHNGHFGFDRACDSQPWAQAMDFLEITNSIRLAGTSVAYLSAQTYALTNLWVDTGSVVKLRGNPFAVNADSGGTEAAPHGAGATVICPSVTVNGTLSAFGEGFPGSYGPGLGTGTDGSAHGGQGSGPTSKPYGRLARPSALGSGNLAAPGNQWPGGGVVRLIVDGTLAVNGMIDASGYSWTRSGAGGSVWLTASNLTGNGAITACGGSAGTAPSAGGGGRIALSAVTDAFSGTLSVAGGATTSTLQSRTGTLFRCTAPLFGCGDPGLAACSLETDFAVQSNGVFVTREVTRWGRVLEWTDQSRDNEGNPLANTADYTLSGLPPDTVYAVYTNEMWAVARVDSGPQGTVAVGGIALQPAAAVRIQPVVGGTTLLIR